jgi:alpha-glucosidase
LAAWDGAQKALLQIRTIDQPGVHASIRAMRQVADAYPDRVMIGEAYLPIDRLMAYYGADLTGFHLPFNFHLISTDWKPQAVGALIEVYEAALPAGGWPNWVLGNHDRSRVASRIGVPQARVAAMLLLTLRGTPTIYQGEELGMVDTPIPPHLVQDPLEHNVPGFGLGRDPVRTPMPWSSEPHGGFTGGQPWLPLHADADVLNVSNQANDPRSMLSLYRALIRLRRDNNALSLGDWRLLTATEHILIYERQLGRQRVVVALNMTGQARSLKFQSEASEMLLSTYLDDHFLLTADEIDLRADEGIILRTIDNTQQGTATLRPALEFHCDDTHQSTAG